MKILILDSGPLINLSMNGLLHLLKKLKESSEVEIIITSEVYKEVVKRPIGIPRFELGAIRIKNLIKNGTIKTPKFLEIDEEQIISETNQILGIINSAIKMKRKPIDVVSPGETSCLALSKILSEKNIENIIGIDERTTRLLFEKPKNLEKIMSRKLHRDVKINLDILKKVGNFKFIRSSEIVYVSYKKGLTELKDSKALEALLYATKFKGTSISWEELDVMKKL